MEIPTQCTGFFATDTGQINFNCTETLPYTTQLIIATGSTDTEYALTNQISYGDLALIFLCLVIIIFKIAGTVWNFIFPKHFKQFMKNDL